MKLDELAPFARGMSDMKDQTGTPLMRVVYAIQLDKRTVNYNIICEVSRSRVRSQGLTSDEAYVYIYHIHIHIYGALRIVAACMPMPRCFH